MVLIERSYSWDEFRDAFVYDWIQKLLALDEHNYATDTARIFWLLGVYVFTVILFVTAASLMLIFYRRLDPRYPQMRAQPLTFRELFLDLKPRRGKPFRERYSNLADEASSRTPTSKTAKAGEAELIDDSAVEAVVASSTPLATPTMSAEGPIVVSSTPLVSATKKHSTAQSTPQSRGSAEPLLPKKTPVMRATKTQASGEKSSKEKALPLDVTYGSSDLVVEPTFGSAERAQKAKK